MYNCKTSYLIQTKFNLFIIHQYIMLYHSIYLSRFFFCCGNDLSRVCAKNDGAVAS